MVLTACPLRWHPSWANGMLSFSTAVCCAITTIGTPVLQTGPAVVTSFDGQMTIQFLKQNQKKHPTLEKVLLPLQNMIILEGEIWDPLDYMQKSVGSWKQPVTFSVPSSFTQGVPLSVVNDCLVSPESSRSNNLGHTWTFSTWQYLNAC